MLYQCMPSVYARLTSGVLKRAICEGEQTNYPCGRMWGEGGNSAGLRGKIAMISTAWGGRLWSPNLFFVLFAFLVRAANSFWVFVMTG